MNIENIDIAAQTSDYIINATVDKLEEVLNKSFPNHITFEKGKYTITRGSTQVMVIVRPFTKNNCSVEFVATVVTDCEITEELTKFLLRKNSELHIGGFGLLFDDTIIFQHSLPGNLLNSESLTEALNVVSAIADYYDDEIIQVAGGKRAIDM